MATYKKKKAKKSLKSGIVHVNANFNNTLITVTDDSGAVFAWETAGTVGYKGSRKSTPYAAQIAMERVSEKVTKMGMREAEIRVRGPGAGRESAVRALIGSGITVKTIVDVTPLPHNGCRAPKKRRV